MADKWRGGCSSAEVFGATKTRSDNMLLRRVSFTTGHAGRYELIHSLELFNQGFSDAAKRWPRKPDGTGGFIEELVPSSFRAAQQRHYLGLVRREYGKIVTEMEAVVTHCRTTAGSVTIGGSSSKTTTFTQGDSVLKIEGQEYPDAQMFFAVNALLTDDVKSHFVTPDQEAAFRTHLAERDTHYRAGACERASAELVSLRENWASVWTPTINNP